MKIEKINDNQIKCTLNKSDLTTRQIKLSELAYGTDKAKELFSDMMQQAASEVGFEAEDIPLMIEAIPVSAECIILVVTKVEDPEELDTRFSQFSPYTDDMVNTDFDDINTTEDETANVIDLFKRLKDTLLDEAGADNIIPATDISSKSASESAGLNESANSSEVTGDIVQVFSFDNIDSVCELGRILSEMYHGHNTLYKLPDDNHYFLIIHSSDQPLQIFNHVCNIMSEYGTCIKNSNGDEAYFIEHGSVICSDNALDKLKNV